MLTLNMTARPTTCAFKTLQTIPSYILSTFSVLMELYSIKNSSIVIGGTTLIVQPPAVSMVWLKQLLVLWMVMRGMLVAVQLLTLSLLTSVQVNPLLVGLLARGIQIVLATVCAALMVVPIHVMVSNLKKPSHPMNSP